MENVLTTIRENPELLHFRIIDSQDRRHGVGSADSSEELEEIAREVIEGLKNGSYKFLLGKYSNLSEKRAKEIIPFQIGKPMSTRSFASQLGYTREDIEALKQEAFEAGKKEAEMLYLRDKVAVLDRRIETLETKFVNLVKILDEADGTEDNSFLGKGLDVLTQAKEATELFKDFKI